MGRRFTELSAILFAAGARWSGPDGRHRHLAWARDLWADLRRLADAST